MFNNQMQTPSVYGYQYANKDSTIDRTMLNFCMWKGTIRIGIYPIIESDSSDEIRYDKKNGVTAYLTPSKALMFAKILKNYKEDRKNNSNHGVAAGQSLITVVNPEDYDKSDANTVISIRKINQNGQIESSYCYEFKKNFYNEVNGFNEKTGSFKQEFSKFNDLELDMFIIQLEEYVKAMTNAQAFSTLHNSYYIYDKIASKLGLDLNTNYNSNGYNRQSYFNTNDGSGRQQENQMESTDLASVMGQMK